MEKSKLKKLNKTEKDLLKIIKKINRKTIGFSPIKMTKNKKKYSRKNSKINIKYDNT